MDVLESVLSMPAPLTLAVPFCAATDPGLARPNNEDRYSVDAGLGLFAVIDGVGGQVAGEVASECVACTMLEYLQRPQGDDDDTGNFTFDPALSETGNRLRSATLMANRALAQRTAADDELTGMAATMTAVLLRPSHATIGNVGDCRTYLFRGGALTQITQDHSWVGEQVRAGVLTPEAASHHPMRNVVTRALDGQDRLDVDIFELDVEPSDTLLLCSDGLSSMASDAEIVSCLTAAGADAHDACQRLVEAAKLGGGKDNITVVVVKIPHR